jgi:NADPH:quinone reductase-like Zn-dependent oxidoreductase
MRAVIQDGIGPPEILQVRSVPVPREPTSDEVLIRVRAAGVCYHDLLVREGTYRQLVQFPLVPGHEMAGDVLAVGERVTRIKVGDQVASTNRETCGHCDLCRSGQEGISGSSATTAPARMPSLRWCVKTPFRWYHARFRPRQPACSLAQSAQNSTLFVRSVASRQATPC